MSRKWLVVGIAGAVAIVGFLLFRPDTLLTNVRSDESLEDAFAVASESEEATAESVSGPDDTDVESVTGGSFFGIDHRAAGTATIYQNGDRFILRLEDDTDIQNGPDLYVWLLAADSYDGGDPGEHLDLGVLTANQGGQNYELPEGFDPSVHRAVLVWCLRFRVPFAAAALS